SSDLPGDGGSPCRQRRPPTLERLPVSGVSVLPKGAVPRGSTSDDEAMSRVRYRSEDAHEQQYPEQRSEERVGHQTRRLGRRGHQSRDPQADERGSARLKQRWLLRMRKLRERRDEVGTVGLCYHGIVA